MRFVYPLVCAALIFASPASTAFGSGTTAKPQIILDGRLHKGEWRGARSHKLGEATLLTKHRGDTLFIGIRQPRTALRYADIYIQNGQGRLLNLHASFRQGERTLSGIWSDGDPPFVWEPTTGWQSSVVPRTSAARNAPVREQIASFDGYEMRIPSALLGPRPWRIRVELRDFERRLPDWVYPKESTRLEPSGWAVLE